MQLITMKANNLHKVVRFEEPSFANEQIKGEDWRELLPVEKNKNVQIEQKEELSFIENENDDREEWIPATSKVTVIQRDAPPLETDEILNDQDEVIVETYLAVAKRNPNRDVGISFTRVDSDSPLCIDHITTHGPFSYTDLESGMVVSAINGKYMTWSSPEEAMAELEKETTMNVTAEFAPDKYYCKEYTMILEANLEEYCGDYGVTFERKGENLPLYVKDVKEDGPFADLLPGLKVMAIDDQFMAWESQEKAQEALYSSNGSKCITVEATTENVNTSLQRVGFEMKEESKEVVITEVEIFTKHCPCDLREGMTVVMLNGQVCSEASSVDELMKDADTTFDIIAVDLNCRRVLVNQDISTGEAMLTFCGAGALGMAAVSFKAIDMCTHPLNNMLTQQNALAQEAPEDGATGTRQLLQTAEEDVATRVAAGSEDAVNGKDASNSETRTESTIDSELETAHNESKPSDEVEREQTHNIPFEQDKITIVSEDARAEHRETISEQEDASTQVTVKSGVKTARSLADRSDEELTNTAEGSRKPDFKSEQAIAPAAILNSTPPSSSKKANESQKNDESMGTPKPFFDTNEKRSSFEFTLDNGKVEKAPTTMHSFQIQKISNEDVGFKLAMGQYGGVYIAEMKSFCKFRGTGLKSGMRIAKINGVDCPTSMRVTTSYINAVDGTLNLVTTFGARPKETKRREIFFSNY